MDGPVPVWAEGYSRRAREFGVPQMDELWTPKEFEPVQFELLVPEDYSVQCYPPLPGGGVD